jgi:hypothetical protein
MGHFTHEAIMRALLGLLALIGLAGIVSGVLAIIRGAGTVPFTYENYGGPGPIIGGIVLLAVSLYLLRIWRRYESPGSSSASRPTR